MMNNVIRFPAGHSRADHDRRFLALQADGRKADRKMRNRKAKIHPDERRIIASRLNDEIVESRIKPGRLAEEAGLANGTRELDKMRWHEGNREDKELLAYSHRYHDVMKALAKLSRQSLGLLVDRVTVGTRLHSLRADDDLSEIEKTQRALEAAANEVDRHLRLFDQFGETLRLKCEGFARGELDDWPYYSLHEEEIPSTNGEPGMWGDITQAKWQARVEGTYGFWEEGGDWSSGPVLSELGYLPHAYLGVLINWDEWLLPGDLHSRGESRQELSKEYGRVPTARYAEGELPEVVNTKKCVHDPRLSVHAIPHTWLILYPDRSMSKIIPVLMTLSDDFGASIELITPRLLIELKKMEVIGKYPKAYDGLVELLAPPAEGKSLVDHWTETGRWFRQNPLLHRADRTAQARARRDMLFTSGETDEQN